MRFNEFLAMPRNQRVEELRRSLDRVTLDVRMAFDRGHTTHFHTNKTHSFHLSRVVETGKASSSFIDEETAIDAVRETLWATAPSIVSWLDKTDGIRNPPRLKIAANYGDEVGRGISADLKEIATDGVQVVLSANRNPTLGNGCAFFNIVTFYPLLSHETAKETGRSFAEEAKEMINKSDYPVIRGYWALWGAGYEPEIKESASHRNFVETHVEHHGRTFSVLCNSFTPGAQFPHISLLENGVYTKLDKLPPGAIRADEVLHVIREGKAISSVFSDADKGVFLPRLDERFFGAELTEEISEIDADKYGDIEDSDGLDDIDY